jgi:16S rRNA C967 or C1407 C5-methylase (RsmB/RsmF family)/NOL1/NOP2/fmu family ribosome biogenesis protein
MHSTQKPPLPQPFLERMRARLGNEFEDFLASLEQQPPTSVRINPLKGPDLFTEDEKVPWCQYGRYLPQRPAYIWDPLYHAGCYYAQEASSMLFGNAIDFSKPLKVLDLCAAPGGKSSLILSFLNENSLLVSNELVGKRVNVLYENLVKWGNTNSVVTCNRTSDFAKLAGLFDVVLVDAPCSGEGMFRKDEGAVAQWSEGLVSQCSAIQKTILHDAFTALAEGGLLIYSTCTFEPPENEENIQWLYQQYGDMLSPAEIPVKPEWNLWPIEIPAPSGKPSVGYYAFFHRIKGEGLFVTALRKNTNAKTGSARQNRSGKINALSKEKTKAVESFLKRAAGHILVEFGGKIHLVKESNLPLLEAVAQNLYVRKLGTKIGILKGSDLIPDHELAMSIHVADSVPSIEVDHATALQYQQRNAIPVPEGTPKGWILIRYKNINLGWAKNVGNRLNNHYPTEWRIRKDIREWQPEER